MAVTAVYTLNPAMPVLLRPDGAVQVGWDPGRAVLVRPPAGLSATALAGLLRTMQTPAGLSRRSAEVVRHGAATAVGLTALLDALVAAGVATARDRPARSRAPSIRIHGRGPLSDLLVETLRCSGARLRHSTLPHAAIGCGRTDLVVLADALVTEPRLVRELHAERMPHLPVRVRDGTGLVGPLVLPGVTSCLTCADLHRRDRDAAWPAVAVQLRDTIGHADRATILATVALALNQVDRVMAAVRGTVGAGAAGEPVPPPTLNATLEFNLATGLLLTRRWTRHPLCDCATPMR